jgi:hypothetical protein
VLFGSAGPLGPDEKEFLKRAKEPPPAEQVLDNELKRTFDMRNWSLPRRDQYLQELDPVLYQHIMKKPK